MRPQGKELTLHVDERGFFVEAWRASWGMDVKQVSHSRMYQGVVKAWHWHRQQTDVWHVVRGVLLVALYHPVKHKLLTEIMSAGGTRVVRIPPGWWHGCKVLSGPCDLIYMTDYEYDGTDEFREPHDIDPPGYDWLKGAPIT